MKSETLENIFNMYDYFDKPIVLLILDLSNQDLIQNKTFHYIFQIINKKNVPESFHMTVNGMKIT